MPVMRIAAKRFAARAAVVLLLLSPVMLSPAIAQQTTADRALAIWNDGLLAGLAQTVTGLDHLALIATIGLVSAFGRGICCIRFGLIAAMLIGATASLLGLIIPSVETLAAVSVLVAGMALVQRRVDVPNVWLGLALAAGLVHGAAIVVPAVGLGLPEQVAFITGIALATGLLLLSVHTFSTHVLIEEGENGLKVQAAGGAVTALGVFCVATAIAM